MEQWERNGREMGEKWDSQIKTERSQINHHKIIKCDGTLNLCRLFLVFSLWDCKEKPKRTAAHWVTTYCRLAVYHKLAHKPMFTYSA